jgi:formyltetrahydrofolate-dependent phosphoribosylglycinamide formyltransferase
MLHNMATAPSSISSPESVRALRDRLHQQGKRLVFTNGCFDLLHAGHVRYLAEARALGDAMVIAMNSDASVQALKGPSRPINTQEDRAEILLGLRSVDAVCVFSDQRATALIDAIQPHVYAKGGDYTIESLNAEEHSALVAAKAEIKILPLVPGRSTTATIQRMNAPAESATPRLMRIGIMGSGAGSNFQSIVDAISSGDLAAEISCVISDVADSGILAKAKAAGLSSFYVDPGPTKAFSAAAQKEACEHLQRAQVDIVVLAGFLRLVKQPLLSQFADRMINIHPSLLPKYKGSRAMQEALENGELETGSTVHMVTAALDDGPILDQVTVPIMSGDDLARLDARIKIAEHELLPRVLSEWATKLHTSTQP